MNRNQYDGILQRPFLAEHWHKGLMAAFAIWLPAFFGALGVLPDSMTGAVVAATTISLAVLATVLTHYEGFTLDLHSRRYRRYTWAAGVRVGRWYPLPLITLVTVRCIQKKHFLPVESQPSALGIVATERIWQVLLRVDQSPVGIIAANATEEKALRIAATLATLLNTEVLVQS